MMRAVHLRIGTMLVSGFVVALLAATNIACFGQTVIIRIVNVTNENPVRNQPVLRMMAVKVMVKADTVELRAGLRAGDARPSSGSLQCFEAVSEV
jgi:hypothetical protein